MTKPTVFLVRAQDNYGPLELPLGMFPSHREAKAAVYLYCEEMGDVLMSDRGGHYHKLEITKHTVGRLGPPTKTWVIDVDDL